MRVFNSALAAVTIAATLLVTLALLLVGMTDAADSLMLTRNTDVYSVIFHLKRIHSEAEIEKTFWDIATPGNARYRQHLNKQQLKELHAAPQSVISKTRDFLVTQLGCTSVKQLETDDALVCNLDKRVKRSVAGHAQVEKAFVGVEPEYIATDFADKLPLQVRKLIRYAIAYRSKLSKPKSAVAKQAKNVNGQPGMTQTPYTINNRYNVPAYANFPNLDPTVTAAVGEFEGEYFYTSDNTGFAQNYNLNPFNVQIMGANTPSANADQTEGTLDLQYIGSVFNNSQPILWAEGGVNNNDPGEIDFTRWINNLLNQSPVPTIVSISWGMGVYNFEGEYNLIFAFEDAFRKGGLAGMTILVASGDSGVGVRQKTFSCNVFHPNYPSTSQYVTAVGATYADSSSEGEKAVNWSGGGFSNLIARPSYQQSAVNHYLRTNTNLPASSYYNASGRAYPDVSALGTNFNINVQGTFQLVSGTSAASPTFAGVLTLIAAERSANGQPALGFLNPTIYALGKVGYDVVEGQNQDTNCIPGVPIEGFAAQKGWDPVSGLGTPDYQFLRANL